jgi:hypothetical protein
MSDTDPIPELFPVSAHDQLNITSNGMILGAVEVLDRDGQMRMMQPITRWPVCIGRALDNDIVLDDPHVAPHHLRLSLTNPAEGDTASSVQAEVLQTVNGALVGRVHLDGDSTRVLEPQIKSIDITLGRTQLRLRLAGEQLLPEQPLPRGALMRRLLPNAAALLPAALVFALQLYLSIDPDTERNFPFVSITSAITAVSLWALGWALASKLFSRRLQYWRHLRIAALGYVAFVCTNLLLHLIAYSFSWAWLANFDFIAEVAVIALVIHAHLQVIQPLRHREFAVACVAFFVTVVGINLVVNHQTRDRLAEQLYMTSLYPPALRLAKPREPAEFFGNAYGLKKGLEQAAKTGDDDSYHDSDDE